MTISMISPPASGEQETWNLERRNDVLIVGFELPISDGWGRLFEAMKAEVKAGARVVVFPRDMPAISRSGIPVFQELVRFLVGSGVAVQRGIQIP
jgi:hypothetical protein